MNSSGIIHRIHSCKTQTAIFNPRGETLKVGLQTTVATRFTGTENQILKTVAMKNNMHYLKQNTAITTSEKFAA